jgi:stringent starvation protein B
MTQLIPTKPYMIRAIHEWCVDNGLTPHLLVAVNTQTRVPLAYVKDGEIVLNINYSATKDLHIDNDAVVFSARFGGVSQNLYIPVGAIKGVFARENGQGMFFEPEVVDDVVPAEASLNKAEKVEALPSEKRKPTLKIVK